MKHTKTVEVPATTREELIRVTCDLCGATVKTRGWGQCDVVSFEITRTKGHEFPEGGSLEATKIDMCGGCFETKLVPWLKSQGGAEPRTEDAGW